ncbi:MAG: hypothetical protein AAF993_18105 [Pseudomonadota bacterium]
MSRKRNGQSAVSMPRGVSLPAAIFLLLVASLLAAAINQTVLVSAQSTSISIMNHRALLTAYSGAQLSLNRLYAPGTGVCDAVTWDMSQVPQLTACDAEVSCQTLVAGNFTSYTVTSTGVCTDGAVQTRRSVLVRARAD